MPLSICRWKFRKQNICNSEMATVHHNNCPSTNILSLIATWVKYFRSVSAWFCCHCLCWIQWFSTRLYQLKSSLSLRMTSFRRWSLTLQNVFSGVAWLACTLWNATWGIKTPGMSWSLLDLIISYCSVLKTSCLLKVNYWSLIYLIPYQIWLLKSYFMHMSFRSSCLANLNNINFLLLFPVYRTNFRKI